MTQAFICDAQRTPFGRYGGALQSVRTDDLGAVPLRALTARNARVDWEVVNEVIFGCANQAGEDNRNVARKVALLAGLPISVPGRGEPDDRRRRGEHESRTLRDAQSRERLQPQQRGLRQHHRLARRQPADEGAVQCRRDARDGRQRGRLMGVGMGVGPAPATRRVLELNGLGQAQMDMIELNEAFAAQGLAVPRELGLADDDARLVATAVNQLHRTGGCFALCTMCIGVGRGIALVIERV